jgi:BCD family chlorophyll transporter-like MFS transporter
MKPFGWVSVARLGVVQACLGAIVVLTTSTLNRVMVVELALPALLPGLLVALHYAVQIARPRMGHGSDVGGRRTPWIVGGMAVLAIGGVLSAMATVWMASDQAAGLALAVLGFALVGLGVSASGTSLLVLLAKRVPEARRGGAATLVWMMMIAGFALTAGLAGHFLDPYSPERLMAVTATVSLIAFAISLVAVRGLEGHGTEAATEPEIVTSQKPNFRDALAQVWDEPVARRFTIFVFVSMLAYSAQDLILEPFAGAVHGYTPGASTQLAGVQHGGVLLGMLLVAMAGGIAMRFPSHPLLSRVGSLRAWTVGGCVASALALFGLMLAGLQGAGLPLKLNVFLLGVANGAFSIGAIGSMMRLAHEGGPARAGIRMGLWGAAQALAFGIGGLVGTGASDLVHHMLALPGSAYATVFALEGMVFLVSAALAWRISRPTKNSIPRSFPKSTADQYPRTPQPSTPLSVANHPRQA